MTEELKTIDTVDTSPFRKMVMTIGELPTSFVDSMTYYELLAWLCNYLENTVTKAVNNNAEVSQELQEKYIELKSFVDNYFDNLDVQEEINNKLDQMAEDGTLQEIITTYIQSNVAWTFDTVADMKNATNLIDGSYAKTLGYHTINDGGGAIYYITDSGTANEEDVIAIGSTLYANLITPINLTPEMFGAYGDGTNDDTEIIQDCINYISGKSIKLLLINKYLITPILTIDERNICLLLKTDITIEGNNLNSGFIVDDTNDQIYWGVFYGSGVDNEMKNITLKNFEVYQNDNNLADIETTNKNPRYIVYTTNQITNFTIDGIHFNHVYSRDVIIINYAGNISSNIKVSNCVIDYFNVRNRVNCTDCTAIFLNCKNYICNDNIVNGANFACYGGIEMHGHNGTAKNNKVFECTDCMHIQPSGNGPANIELENNFLYGYDGINLWDSTETTPSTYGLVAIRILNNYVQIESGTNAPTYAGGIRLSSSSFSHKVKDVHIENNTIEFVNIDTTRSISSAFCGGIVLNNTNASTEDLFIIGNTILSSISGGIKIGSSSSNATTTNENIYIKENIIKDCGRIAATNQMYNSGIAIIYKYLKNIVIEDNMLLNSVVEDGAQYAFYGVGTVDDDHPCYFKNNIIKSVNSGDMTVAGTSTWVYQNQKQIPIFSPNGTKYYIKVANDGTLSTS